jgi:hypothetical protein
MDFHPRLAVSGRRPGELEAGARQGGRGAEAVLADARSATASAPS